eukprot:TRINITY_DN6470_c0_g1_i1.p1 TRINITY_DN6470_c0_g1~~TRINITY_DN6470_c0_g1_i1.p1  ORF type:complete len:161 (+),score=30.06 TRINITY_DN6470_c0_g1_i1:448-930(+)
MHSIQRPPYSICIFSLIDLKLINSYFMNTYFRNFNLYHYVFTPNMVLSLTERKVVPTLMPISIPPLASSKYVENGDVAAYFEKLKQKNAQPAPLSPQQASPIGKDKFTPIDAPETKSTSSKRLNVAGSSNSIHSTHSKTKVGDDQPPSIGISKSPSIRVQ